MYITYVLYIVYTYVGAELTIEQAEAIASGHLKPCGPPRPVSLKSCFLLLTFEKRTYKLFCELLFSLLICYSISEWPKQNPSQCSRVSNKITRHWLIYLYYNILKLCLIWLVCIMHMVLYGMKFSDMCMNVYILKVNDGMEWQCIAASLSFLIRRRRCRRIDQSIVKR